MSNRTANRGDKRVTGGRWRIVDTRLTDQRRGSVPQAMSLDGTARLGRLNTRLTDIPVEQQVDIVRDRQQVADSQTHLQFVVT